MHEYIKGRGRERGRRGWRRGEREGGREREGELREKTVYTSIAHSKLSPLADIITSSRYPYIITNATIPLKNKKIIPVVIGTLGTLQENTKRL